MNLSSLVLMAVGIFFGFVGVVITAAYILYKLKSKTKNQTVRY